MFASPTLTLAVAMAAGVTAQALARRLSIPGIVFLLAVGVLLGPDGAALVRPSSLGRALHGVIGFGVAVILFEGGMNQHLASLRRQAVAIRRLVTLGALITAAGGAVAAMLILDWGWRLSTLFGTLVIVTGPTVITPLLRRIRVTHRLETVLEAEGIFVDAVGAIIAVAALEFCINPTAISLANGAFDLAIRIATGGTVGVAGGLLLFLVLGRWRAIPKGLENIFALSIVLLTFELGDALMPECGIVAAIVCGMVVGNSGLGLLDQLSEFKEQLTVLLIAVLFVLLAADVRIADIYALGLPGLSTVAVLMFIVRPLTVFICTWQTELKIREKLFLSWLAPRGIVAAAVASLFAHELADAGIPGGTQVRALVFLVIAVTVLVQGITGRPVARLLGVRRPGPEGHVIVGANAVGRAIGAALRARGEAVTLIDTSHSNCALAMKAQLPALVRNALQESTLLRAKVESKRALVCATTSEKVNFMVARLVAQEHSGPKILVAVTPDADNVTSSMIDGIDVVPLPADVSDIEHWIVGLRRNEATVETWQRQGKDTAAPPFPSGLPKNVLIPLVAAQDDSVVVVDAETELAPDAEVDFAIWLSGRNQAEAWLSKRGWKPAPHQSSEAA